MKIVVIGTINRDLILTYQGGTIQSLGGIFYSMSALSEIGSDEVEIIPVSYLGNDLYQPFLSLLENYHLISKEGLTALDQKNHKVILEYKSPEDRTEKALFNFPSLEWNHLNDFADADFFLINMITGWDISLDAFLKLSHSCYHRMYLDVHFLVMGIDKMGKRFPKRPENIEQWLSGARFIQMNEREFKIIAGNDIHEKAFYDRYFNPDQVLIITLGSQGARVLFTKENIVRNKHFPGIKIESVKDATGCGDVFGVGFVWRYLQSQNIFQATEFANLAAAANCLLEGTNQMDNMVSIIQELSELG